jgi:hypothetical protein
MDMNNQKVKENNPPSFRMTEVSDPRRRLVGLNRLFESANLRLWDSLAPLTQFGAWRERERGREREKEKKEIEGDSENDQDEPRGLREQLGDPAAIISHPKCTSFGFRQLLRLVPSFSCHCL